MTASNKQIYTDEIITQLAFKIASKIKNDNYSFLTKIYIIKDKIINNQTGVYTERLNNLTISYFAYEILKNRDFKPISLCKLVKNIGEDWDDLMMFEKETQNVVISIETIKNQLVFEIYKDLKIVKDRNNKEFLISESFTSILDKMLFENVETLQPRIETEFNEKDFIYWFKNRFLDDHRTLKLLTFTNYLKERNIIKDIKQSTLKQELLNSKCLHVKNNRNYLSDDEIKNVYTKYFKYDE